MFEKTLYGLDKKGGFKVWTIVAIDQIDYAIITVSHGKDGGAIQAKTELVEAGKQGRSCYEQAVSQAEGKIKKQIDKGYRENKADLEELPLIAMLAGDYNKIGHRIKFPCLVSDKFDGVRCLAKCTDLGVVTLESRTGQPYYLPHITAQLVRTMNPGEVFDGEIYLHGYALQDITSAVKRVDTQEAIDKAQRKVGKVDEKRDEDSDEWDEEYNEAMSELIEAESIHKIRPLLEFHVFDRPDVDEQFWERVGHVTSLEERFVNEHNLRVVKYSSCLQDYNVAALHADAVARGFEGLMLRNLDGMYESGKRSADLQKYKMFLDSEFPVVGHTRDKDGLVVYICKNDVNDETFTVVFGTHDERKSPIRGEWLTVKYQSRYKGTLLPQFPVGVCFRDCDAAGNPVE